MSERRPHRVEPTPRSGHSLVSQRGPTCFGQYKHAAYHEAPACRRYRQLRRTLALRRCRGGEILESPWGGAFTGMRSHHAHLGRGLAFEKIFIKQVTRDAVSIRRTGACIVKWLVCILKNIPGAGNSVGIEWAS